MQTNGLVILSNTICKYKQTTRHRVIVKGRLIINLIAIFFVVKLYSHYLWYFRSLYREGVYFASISSLLPLLNFLIGTDTLLDEIPTYFLRMKAALNIKRERSRKSSTRPLSWKFPTTSIFKINLKWSR